MATIEVKVHPKAKRNAIELSDGSTIKVSVTAAPERGRANQALVALLAKRLGIPKGAVRLVRGERSRTKVLLVEGIESADLLARLSAES